MKSPHFHFAFLFLVAAAAMLGCHRSQTSVTQLWQAHETRPAMQRVLVFGARLDEANRHALEDGFVQELGKHGVTAHPAYEIFPTEPTDLEKARASVRERGFDGIVVATMKGVHETQTFYPGHYEPGFWTAYARGWGYGRPMYFYQPGYVETDEEVSVETTVWDVRDADHLVWAALTRTTNPSAGRAFVRSLVGTVVRAIARAGLVPQGR